jgi:peptidoglycan/LPS O-acetylase OafA/YrhL
VAARGFLGVEVFMVVSGYLITSLLVGEWDRAQGSISATSTCDGCAAFAVALRHVGGDGAVDDLHRARRTDPPLG